jgi:two-component system, NtrC family, sensor kinase
MRTGRVLIVDDEPYVRNGLNRLLRGEFETIVAEDGEDALLRIENQERFHVIICDVQMARISGPSFRDSVRRLAPHLADRIIFLTGCADPELKKTIQDHLILTKPFVAEELRTLVRSVATAAIEGYFPRRIVTKQLA